MKTFIKLGGVLLLFLALIYHTIYWIETDKEVMIICDFLANHQDSTIQQRTIRTLYFSSLDK